MVKYRHPKPNDRDPITRSPEPIHVTFGWPISGSFQPRMDGLALAWQGDKDTGVTLVRLDTGKEAWVETSGVKRVKTPGAPALRRTETSGDAPTASRQPTETPASPAPEQGEPPPPRTRT